MLAGRYTLLEQPALDDLLPVCQQRGISVVAAGVFNSGLLARRTPALGAKYNYSGVPPQLLQHAGRIAAICEQHTSSLPAAALAFPAGHPAVISICVGARSPKQVEQNAALFQMSPPSALWAQLKEEGLLRADAPVPATA
jgi:D-threo-aldose 1-dehydrogenase